MLEIQTQLLIFICMVTLHTDLFALTLPFFMVGFISTVFILYFKTLDFLIHQLFILLNSVNFVSFQWLHFPQLFLVCIFPSHHSLFRNSSMLSSYTLLLKLKLLYDLTLYCESLCLPDYSLWIVVLCSPLKPSMPGKFASPPFTWPSKLHWLYINISTWFLFL